MDLQDCTVYTTKSIASYIYGANHAAALKRAERWIVERALNFDCLNVEKSTTNTIAQQKNK